MNLKKDVTLIYIDMSWNVILTPSDLAYVIRLEIVVLAELLPFVG